MPRKTTTKKRNNTVSASPKKPSISKSKRTVQASRTRRNPVQEFNGEENAASISIQEKVALLAYSYWEKRGRQGGSPEEDWYRAEREVLERLGMSRQ